MTQPSSQYVFVVMGVIDGEWEWYPYIFSSRTAARMWSETREFRGATRIRRAKLTIYPK